MVQVLVRSMDRTFMELKHNAVLNVELVQVGALCILFYNHGLYSKVMRLAVAQIWH